MSRSWTLRPQRLYSPCGNGPQNHSAARRAVRQLRRHGLESSRVVRQDPDRIVAWRKHGSHALHCASCRWSLITVPVTSEELPDGGFCSVCGRDVLI